MLSSIKDVFATSPVLAWSVVGVLLAFMVIAVLWERVKWWWLNTWMSFPLIGRIARLAKDINRENSESTWYKAEVALCRAYQQFIRIKDEHDFNEKVAYLTKAGDNGRRPTPVFIWLLTIVLVFVEAMGFSYVLAGWTIPGASESAQQIGAIGIAFMVSVILVAFTHWAGHELYVTGKVNGARKEWVEAGKEGRLKTRDVALATPQSVDDDQPGYTQLGNRVGTAASYKITILTMIIIAVVAAGATYVRGQVLEKMIHDEVVGQKSDLTSSNDSNGLGFGNGGVIPLPAEDATMNFEAKIKAVDDAADIERHGGWGTFIVLAFIFIFLQILGIVFGFKWGFAGRESKTAYVAMGAGRFSSYSDVREYYKQVADVAQAKLEQLQQRMMDENSRTGGKGVHTANKFYDFMRRVREEDAADHKNESQHADLRKAEKSRSIAVDSTAKQATSSSQDELARALSHFDSIDANDKERRTAYILAQPEYLQNLIKAELRERKNRKAAAEELAKKQAAAELEDLV